MSPTWRGQSAHSAFAGSSMSERTITHWVSLGADEAFVPWMRIAPLILAAKLGDGHPDDEEKDFEYGFKRAGAAEEVDATVAAAVTSGQLTLLGPDSHFPVKNSRMRPRDAVVARGQLVSFLASHGIGVETQGDSPLEAPASPSPAPSLFASQAETSAATTSTENQPARPVESSAERQDRRLARFQELGGVLKRVPGAWNVDTAKSKRGALAELVAEEKSALRPRSDRKDISADLNAAMERRRGC